MLLDQGGKFVQLAKGLYLEGLAVDYVREIVWYSDVIGGGVFGLERDGNVITLNPDRMWTGGILINHDGAVLSTGADGIMWNNPETGASGVLIDEIDGEPIPGVNEMIPDGAGGFYFDTIDLVNVMKGEPTRPAAIYRFTPERELIPMISGIGLANGMMRSADGTHLYCNETFDAMYQHDVLPDLSLANRRKLLQKEDCDGMAADVEGNLWVTGFRSSEILRIDAEGAQLRPVPGPSGSAVTQIRFGGADMCDFYLTCVPPDGGDNLAIGIFPTEERSYLCRGRSEVPGLRIEPLRLDLG